jgi:hypothetical protein
MPTQAGLDRSKAFLRDRLSRGDTVLSSQERTQGEEFVPAGLTAHGRQLQNSPEGGRDSGDVNRRDALQIDIAADRTACVKQMMNRNRARMKSRPAGHAAPRQHACNAEEIIERGSPPGTANPFGMAGRAVHQRNDRESVFPARIRAGKYSINCLVQSDKATVGLPL